MNTMPKPTYDHEATSLHAALRELHLLAARMEAVHDARLYVGELRRLTLRAFLDVASAGVTVTKPARAQTLRAVTRRVARIAALLVVMSEVVSTMVRSVRSAQSLY